MKSYNVKLTEHDINDLKYLIEKYLAYYNEFGTPETISHETTKYTEIYKKLRINEVSK